MYEVYLVGLKENANTKLQAAIFKAYFVCKSYFTYCHFWQFADQWLIGKSQCMNHGIAMLTFQQ